MPQRCDINRQDYLLQYLKWLERALYKCENAFSKVFLKGCSCRPAPFFYIRSYQSTKVLDVRGADPKPGTKLIIYEAKGDMADNQLWYEDQNGIIRSKLNGFAIDTSGQNGFNQSVIPYSYSIIRIDHLCSASSKNLLRGAIFMVMFTCSGSCS